MKEEQYIKERVDDQLNWYSKKSVTNKKYHLWTRGLVIVFSAIIPFAAGFLETHKNDSTTYLNYVIGVLGMLVAILTGVSALMKFQEKWVKYRSTSEALKHEKYLYMTSSGGYKNADDPFHLLVTTVENLISKENATWGEFMNKED